MQKLTIILSVLVGLIQFSCAVNKNHVSSFYKSSDKNRSQYSANSRSEVKRKVNYFAFFELAVENVDTANSQLKNIAAKYDGYVNALGTNRSTIRVKSEHLEAANSDVKKLGKVQRNTVTGLDVTEQYLDNQIRLENAEKARDRYLELLARAENVEAALKVEIELERLNGTIDQIKGKMQRLDHLDEYSTINVELQEKKKPGVLGYIGLGLYHSVKWLFVRN